MTHEQRSVCDYYLACFAQYRACSSEDTRAFCVDQLLVARDEFIALGGTWPQIVYEVEAAFGTPIAKDWQE